jgi:hypothetical protein
MTIDTEGATAMMLHDGFVLGLDEPMLGALWLVPFGSDGDDSLDDLLYTAGSFVTVGTFSGSGLVGVRDAGVGSAGSTDGVAFAVGVTGFPSFPTALGGLGPDHATAIASNGGGAAFVAGDYAGTWTWIESTMPAVGGVDAFWITYVVPGT